MRCKILYILLRDKAGISFHLCSPSLSDRRLKDSLCFRKANAANHCEKKAMKRDKGSERENRDCNRSFSAANALRRVIDNDNFVSAEPRADSSNEPLPLAHRAGGPHEWKESRGRSCLQRTDLTAGADLLGTMRRHRSRPASG